jgi:hypothetical protein
MRSRTMVLARDLAPGDRVVSVGLGGVSGEVTAVRVCDRTVSATFANGSTEALGGLEVCLVDRELAASAEAA